MLAHSITHRIDRNASQYNNLTKTNNTIKPINIYLVQLNSQFDMTTDTTNQLYNQSITIDDCKRRSSIVDNLLDFNLSIGATSSITMQLSCPILSYMNDDEEDSVDLRQVKRPSLVSVVEDCVNEAQHEEGWESLEADGSALPMDAHFQTREYQFELPPVDDSDRSKKKQLKRRRHSYQMLEQRLSESQSPLDILKEWSSSMGGNKKNLTVSLTAPMNASSVASSPEQVKSLELDSGLSDFQQRAREGPMLTNMQCARGA